MTKKSVSFDYEEFTSIEECGSEIQDLYHKALEARELAYAPYSNFRVGAALQLDNGEIITGNNQENAAYPSGLCAERVAIFAAKSRFPKAKIKNLVVVTSAENILEPISPCGNCRQVLVEYEYVQNQDFAIYLQTKDLGLIKINSAKNLLPFGFHSAMLNE